MQASKIFLLMGWLLGIALVPYGQPAGAQTLTNPSTEELVEQLKAPRTRSLSQKRNLIISKDGVAQQAPITADGIATPSDTSLSGQTPTTGVTPGVNGDRPPPGALDSASALKTESRTSVSLLIQFDFNSAVLMPESTATLSRLAAAMASDALSSDRFLIEGHTDAKGSSDFNLRLSKSRADTVRKYLIDQGINPQRLAVMGKGSSDLANKANPLSGENRRVKIVNLE